VQQTINDVNPSLQNATDPIIGPTPFAGTDATVPTKDESKPAQKERRRASLIRPVISFFLLAELRKH
jgi:hypothetical protein